VRIEPITDNRQPVSEKPMPITEEVILLIDLTSYLTKEEFLGKVSPACKPFTDEQTGG
jgi:hypothetical protein